MTYHPGQSKTPPILEDATRQKVEGQRREERQGGNGDGGEERITKAQKNVARMGARKADPQLNKQERHGGWLTGRHSDRAAASREEMETSD